MNEKHNALKQLCLEVLPIWERQLATSRTQSEAAVAEMLKAFAVLEPYLQDLAKQSVAEAIKASMEQMYLGFQFQDRVNQIMALVQEDVGRMLSVLHNSQSSDEDLNVTDWLARMESLYAMAEQHRDHGGTGEGTSAGKDVSFF